MTVAACLSAALFSVPEATAQIVWPQPAVIPVVSGVDNPVHVTNAGDGSGRLFIVERAGRIRVDQNGSLLTTPFLDITGKTSTGGERGLLSVAFPPGYANSGRFYVFYTQASDGDLVIARYQVSATPNVADASSEQILLLIDHSSASNHNGGQLAFSPTDGYLYISTGDGGDTPAEGQNLASLLGKVLRINSESGGPLYSIPANNPFVGAGGARGEIWALGLRNPWRFAFDRTTGDLYLADVGQASWEEVNVQSAAGAGGQNYGWNIMEGRHCYQTATCNQTGLTEPVLEYSSAGSDCAIMGGVVYRGTVYPRMRGVYFYADYCSGKIWGLQYDGAVWQSMLLTTFSQPFALTSFGEGEDGSIYITDSPGDAIYKMTDTTPAARLTLAAGPQLPGSDANPGDENVPMLQFSLTTGTAGVVLGSVGLTASGNGDDSTDVPAVRVVRDANANGIVDQGEPLLGSGAFAADNGAMTVDLDPDHLIPGSTSATYLIVYDLAPVRSAALPAFAGLIVAVALASSLSARGVRRNLVRLIGAAGLCGVVACSNGGEESAANPPAGAVTYQVTLTGVTATDESGGAVALSGFPLVGPVITVR